MSGHHADSARTAARHASATAHPAALPAVREVLQSPGQSLGSMLRGGMERGFSTPASTIRGSGSGDVAESEADRAADTVTRSQASQRNGEPPRVDFSHVRLHTGPAASASAQLIGAKAYASGSHVVFDDRRASLASTEGRHTLAHELAHVVQRVGAKPVSPAPRPFDGHIARKEEYPILHQEILQKLIKIAKQHKNDGPERIPALRELAKSVPEKFRPGLFQRLSKPKGQDAFTDYILINFAKTRDSFIEALALGNTPKAEAAQAEEIVVPPKPTGPPASKEGSTFVTYDFQAVKGDPQYIDNFTNDANDAWFPNERVLILQYPNGAVLRIALADVIKALDLKSELNPGYEPPEKLKKQIEEGEKSGDLVLPRIKGDKDGYTLMTIENKTSFHRDGESQVIYPQRTRIPKGYLPRLAKMVEQIESVRVNTELWMKAAPKLLEIVANMNWSAPRGMGGLIVATGRRIKKAAQQLKGVVVKPKVTAPAKPNVQPPSDTAKATPNKAATSKAAEGMPEITVSKGAKPKPSSGNLVDDVNKDTKELFERRPDLKKALERSPRAARALKKCASPCFPDMDTKQVERLEKMLEEAENAGIFFNDKQITTFLRSKTTPKEVDEALTEMKKALDRAKGVRGEMGEAGAQIGGDRTTPAGRDATSVIRSRPGTATGGEKLPEVTGQWFPPVRGTKGRSLPGSKDIRIAQIPGQIARQLRGKDFKNFADFRQRFWKLVAADPVLKQGWSPQNLKQMQNGSPPGVGKSHLGRSEQTGGGSNAVYNLDHKQRLEDGGGLYDLDNIQVVSPKIHVELGQGGQ